MRPFAKIATAVLLEIGLQQSARRRDRPEGRIRVGQAARPAGGSAMGAARWGLAVRAAHNPSRIIEWFEVREIRIRVGRKGHRAHELRLWTTLIDPAEAPALELARVYASRWEHELYFRELKRQLRRTAVLQSHTVETGRKKSPRSYWRVPPWRPNARAATGTIPPLRISFDQLLAIVRGMWLVLGPFDDIFTDQQKAWVVRRSRALMRRSLTGPRRPRTCPRAVRQPVTRWPGLKKPESIEQPWTLQLL